MTPRPGKLARIVVVPFERPRSLELQLTPEFNKIESEVRNILGSYV